MPTVGPALPAGARRAAPGSVRRTRPGAGLRERNKQQKLERIRRAARLLFMHKGFDATTTREIARRARVGSGTLFLYAKDKRELLLRMFQEDLEGVAHAASASAPQDQGLLGEVLHTFAYFLDHYARAPELARVFLKELLIVGLEGVGALTLEAVQDVADRIARAQQRGEIRADVPPLTAATNFFGVYNFTLHSWLGGYFTTASARSLLRDLIELQIRGLQPR